MKRFLSWFTSKSVPPSAPTPPPPPTDSQEPNTANKPNSEKPGKPTAPKLPKHIINPLTSDHLNFYTYLHGKKFGRALEKRYLDFKRYRLSHRVSVDSPECGSSPTSPIYTSQEIPSCSTQNQCMQNRSTQTPYTTSKKNEIVNREPKSKNIKKRVKICSDERRSPSPVAGPSNANKTVTKLRQANQVYFDAIDVAPRHRSQLSHRPTPRRRQRRAFYESNSSVDDFVHTYSSSVDQIHNDDEFLSDSLETSQAITPEVSYVLSQSVPIRTTSVYYGRWYNWLYNNITYSPRCNRYLRYRSRHWLELSALSPAAPGTPANSRQRRFNEEAFLVPRPLSFESQIGINEDDQGQSVPEAALQAYLGCEIRRSRYKSRRRSSSQDDSYYTNNPSQSHQSNIDPEKEKHTSPRRPKNKTYTVKFEFRFRSKSENSVLRPLNKLKGIMNAIEEQERKIIIEFCHLLEKAKQLFNGLRELPQYGHKQWSLYFGRTFDIYTRLWKYQQQHRALLDSKYGMKRWQIGEIASKIGQLYYHFYLRTSETAYLNEAYSFYYAIRGRCYYTKANKEDKCELMVKKLRYYARFIVVCLLLKKMKLVKDLIKELDRQIIEYGNTYDPDDQVEWTVVVDEVKAFIHAEPVVAVIHPDNFSVIVSNRLTPHSTPAIERTAQMNLTLQEVMIVGSSSQQVRFSELTMDMFRMLQTLEREPTGEVQHVFDESPRARYTSTPNAHSQDNIDGGPKMPNPHKYLLFKPSPNQMLIYLASACNDLPSNGIMLLYLSADGHIEHPAHSVKHPEDATGYEMGGLITTSKNDIYRDCGRDRERERERERERDKDKNPSTPQKLREPHCLYPGDLNAYTRKPFFLIVDSDNSYAFQFIPRLFNQPMVTLMSPLELPSSFHDRRQQGSLFTLFLHSPLSAFCYCCDISNISLVHWDRGLIYIDTFIAEASAIFVRSRVDPSYMTFLGDDFLRLLILRFIFCEVVLRLHRAFRSRSHLSRSTPPLPEDLFEHPALIHIVIDLANHLQVRSHFHDPTAATGPAPTKE